MTVQEIIRRALRRLGHLKLDDEPSPSEYDTGLEALQSVYLDLIEFGADLTDVIVTANYSAGENERIFNTSGSNVVITPPTTVEDLEVEANAAGEHLRPPRDMSVIAIAEAVPEVHAYDATQGAWVSVYGLTLTANAPWSNTWGQGLTALLAVSLADELQLPVPAATAVAALDARTRIIARMQMSSGSLFLQPDLRYYQG
jgi:hypothetical protein